MDKILDPHDVPCCVNVLLKGETFTRYYLTWHKHRVANRRLATGGKLTGGGGLARNMMTSLVTHPEVMPPFLLNAPFSLKSL